MLFASATMWHHSLEAACYSKASSMTTGWLFMHIRLDTAKQQAPSFNPATYKPAGTGSCPVLNTMGQPTRVGTWSLCVTSHGLLNIWTDLFISSYSY